MVWYTGSAHLIPEWVHQFHQWHIDMFESLDKAHQCDVKQHGVWIAYPHATFEQLPPTFIIPAKPILVPVPADNTPWLSLTCLTLREPPPAVYCNDSPELSGLALRAKQLRTRSKTFIHFSVFVLFFLFILFRHWWHAQWWCWPDCPSWQPKANLSIIAHCVPNSSSSVFTGVPNASFAKVNRAKGVGRTLSQCPSSKSFLLSIFISFY